MLLLFQALETALALFLLGYAQFVLAGHTRAGWPTGDGRVNGTAEHGELEGPQRLNHLRRGTTDLDS